MLILFWLLVGLSLGRSENVSYQIEKSINRTIDTVEKILKDDPSLPKLNRNDILRLLTNITTGNPAFEKIEKMTREAYQNAVQPNDQMDSKAPLIQMIPDSKEADAIVEIGKTEEIVFPPNPKDPSPFIEKAEKLVAESSGVSPINTVKIECKTVTDELQNNHRNTYSEPQQNLSIINSINDVIKPSSEPEKFTFNLANLDQITKSAQEYISSAKTKDTPQNTSEKIAIVYSTSINPKPDGKNEDKVTSNYPQLYDPNTNILRLDQWRYMGPPTMKTDNLMPTAANFPGGINAYFELPKKMGSHSVMDNERPAPVYVTPVSSTQDKAVNIGKSESGGFAIATKIETSVKPIDMMKSTSAKPERQEDFSYTNSKKNVKNQNQVSDYSTFDQPPDSYDYDKNEPSEKKVEPAIMNPFGSELSIDNFRNIFTNNMLNNKHVNINEPVGMSSTEEDSASITKQNTFEHPQTDFKKGVENLSPDVRLLFQKFGLQTSLKDILEKPKTTTTTTRKPTTTGSFLDSYTSFKRLPSSKIEDKDMQDFLSQFGLGNVDNRGQKSMQTDELLADHSQQKLSDFDMRRALDNLGLLALVPRTEETTPKPRPKHSSSKKYIFKPHEAPPSSVEQREKINKLLTTVKMVQEGKVDDVQKVVQDLVQTTKTLKSGPNPVDLDEILKLYNEEMQGGKKHQRQANHEETIDMTSTTSTETTESKTTSTENSSTDVASTEVTSTEVTTVTTEKKPSDSLFNLKIPESDSDAKAAMPVDNFAALEESFGGSTAAPDPVLPTRPRSGLYFLVDWNSFLEVGEDGKDKVNLRFQPKVGDKSRFIPVKIP